MSWILLGWSWKNWNFTALKVIGKDKNVQNWQVYQDLKSDLETFRNMMLGQIISPNDSKRLHSSSFERIGMNRHNHYIHEHVVSRVFLGHTYDSSLLVLASCVGAKDASDYTSTIRCHARASHWSNCKGSQGDLGTAEEIEFKCWCVKTLVPYGSYGPLK